MRKKILSLLVLLIAAVTGAWADSYTITLTTISNGSVVTKVNDASVNSAAAGATVMIVATPDDGYKLKTISGLQVTNETFNSTSGVKTINGTYFNLFCGGSTSGYCDTRGWRVGTNAQNNITISSRSNQNLSEVVLTVNGGDSSRSISDLRVNHGTLSATGTAVGSTVTITDINSPTVTVSAPNSKNAEMWFFNKAKISIYDAIDLTDTGDDNVKTFTMPSKNVTISAEFEEVPAVTLTDGNDLSALSTYAEETVDVTYVRSFTKNKASTVCLPFAFSVASANGTFYTFTAIEQDGSGEYVATMTASVSPTLTANTPYLFMPNATGDVNFSGRYAIPASLTAGSYTSGDWTFKGTFETIEWTTAPTGIYGFSALDVDDIYQGQFVKVGEYVRIVPMRCYLECDEGNSDWAGVRSMNHAAKQLPDVFKVRLVSAEGEVTAIGSLHTKTGEVSFDKDGWYTLDGRRVKNPTKGINVNNGKKVIIK